jgi:hypothetical protein
VYQVDLCINDAGLRVVAQTMAFGERCMAFQLNMMLNRSPHIPLGQRTVLRIVAFGRSHRSGAILGASETPFKEPSG